MTREINQTGKGKELTPIQKITVGALSAALALSLSGCGNANATDSKETDSSASGVQNEQAIDNQTTNNGDTAQTHPDTRGDAQAAEAEAEQDLEARRWAHMDGYAEYIEESTVYRVTKIWIDETDPNIFHILAFNPDDDKDGIQENRDFPADLQIR